MGDGARMGEGMRMRRPIAESKGGHTGAVVAEVQAEEELGGVDPVRGEGAHALRLVAQVVGEAEHGDVPGPSFLSLLPSLTGGGRT